jgi:hypothetical protein
VPQVKQALQVILVLVEKLLILVLQELLVKLALLEKQALLAMPLQ